LARDDSGEMRRGNIFLLLLLLRPPDVGHFDGECFTVHLDLHGATTGVAEHGDGIGLAFQSDSVSFHRVIALLVYVPTVWMCESNCRWR